LSGILDKGVTVYVENTFITTITKEKNTSFTNEVIQLPLKAALFAKPELGRFSRTEVEYVG
jgi:hypothetical protein